MPTITCSKNFFQEPRIVFGVERRLDIPRHVNLVQHQLDALENSHGGDNNCEHGWFDSCVGNAKLHYRKWLPKRRKSAWFNNNNNKATQKEEEVVPPKAIVIYVHGIQTHSGNTSYRAHHLNQQGYACYCHDMIGHGFSEGKRWLIPGSFQNNLADLRTFVHLVADEQQQQNYSSSSSSDVPIILMGESFGALLTLHLARQFQENPQTAPANFDSVIITSPAIQVDLPPPPVVWALRWLGAPLFPTWVPFFMPNPVPTSDDYPPVEQSAMVVDDDDLATLQRHLDSTGPLCLRTAAEIVNCMMACRKRTIPGFAVPFCLVHGTNDSTCPIAGADYLWEMTTTTQPDKNDNHDNEREYHRLDGAGHDVFDTTYCKASTRIMNNWIAKRLTARTRKQDDDSALV